MYHPVQANRLFAVDTRYSDVDWNNFQAVIESFQQQVEYWYVLPGLELRKGDHFGFAIAALASLLIDCMSQYEDGVVYGTRVNFIGFLHRHWPELHNPYPHPIDTGKKVQVSNGAEAIYYGVRCGILHEAHVKLYTALTGQIGIAEYHPVGLAIDENGVDVPVVTIDPIRLFDGVHSRFDAFMIELVDANPAYNDARDRFKIKFEASYGVQISINV